MTKRGTKTAAKKRSKKRTAAKKKTVTRAATDPLMSQAAYARRRGISKEAVSKAIREGRLVDCLVDVPHGRGRTKKIGDPELADREWEANTRPSASNGRARDDDEELKAYRTARRSREGELAKQAAIKTEIVNLELRQKRGELVPAAEARTAITALLRTVRTKLLAVPNRIRQRLGSKLNSADVQLIDDLIREALTELADE